MKYMFLFASLFPLCLSAQQISLTKGMVVTHSASIKPSEYIFNSELSPGKPLIVISGKNIVVDFKGAVLRSKDDIQYPNLFKGVAIFIKPGSENIILKNANIHGYKIAVLADSVQHLTIMNCDFSYNYRQQLHSNWKREDISDWLSFHHNEHREWLRYGAGIYLDHCNNAVIKNNTVNNGQCGLLITNCDSADISDNNFSFNSALGIGLYRSSYNHIYNNRLDYDVRGFSFGKYYRGQDSAGILVFEQCNDNVIAYNSVTHGGDGFFLWAGQYTMDTGEGGCNDNLIYNNDFSYAPTNGVELTFSRNYIRRNIIIGCDNGIWGGYSYHTQILENEIAYNNTGIAIEHGQYINILNNDFINNNTSIKLWSGEKQPADWIYAQRRNTDSKDYVIDGNSFTGEKSVYNIMGTDSILLRNNTKLACNETFKLGKRITHLDTIGENNITYQLAIKDTALAFAHNKNIPVSHLPTGRNNIRITPWGPYNFGYPYLFLDSIVNDDYHFTVLHPGGDWEKFKTDGFNIISSNDAELIARADSDMQNRFIHLLYTGEAFADMFGEQHKKNVPYAFGFDEFDPRCIWNVSFYSWNENDDPNKDYDHFFNNLSNPVFSTTTNQIDYTWWGRIGNNLPKDSFATVATTVIKLHKGNYEIGVTGDDLVKLFIDNKPVIDAWDKKYTDLDENTHHAIRIHLKGRHSFKLVHAEDNGLADLMFYIKPSN